jgi:hypothetical protein
MVVSERSAHSLRRVVAHKGRKQKAGESGIPMSTAVYFYSIILFSLFLPVIIAEGLIHEGILISSAIAGASVAITGGTFLVYHELVMHIRALEAGMDQVRLQGRSELSLLGGLVRIKIDPLQRSLVAPAVVREDRTAGLNTRSL